MTNEEFERLKDSIRASLANGRGTDQPDEKELAARRKLDRDMDRLERVLKRIVTPDPQTRQRKVAEDELRQERERQHQKWLVERAEFGARLDQKLKTLIDETRRNRKKRQP